MQTIRLIRSLLLLFPICAAAVIAQAPALVSISVTPASPSIASGSTQQFTATGTYSDSSTQNLTLSATWSSSNAASATISSTGVATALTPGATTISATLGSVSGTTSAVVVDTNLVGWWRFDDDTGASAIDTSGNGSTAALINGASWTAGQIGYAVSADGNSQSVQIPAINLSATKAITWTAWINRTWSSAAVTLLENSSNFNSTSTGFGFFPDDSGDCGSPGTMMTGLRGDVGYTLNCYTQPSSGVWHHLGVVYDKSQTGTRVISLYIDGVLQTPVRQLYTATNTNSFANNPTYLFSRGGFTEYASGKVDDLRIYNQALTAAQIQQIYLQGLGTLTGIVVTPANASVSQGMAQQYTATGTYSNGGPQNLTSMVNWSSSNPGAASITASGLATGATAGSTIIAAVYGAIGGSTPLTVGPPTLQTLTVSPANQSITAGGTQQYMATGRYSDGGNQDLTSSAAWTSSNPTVASISATGLATGATTGSTVIQAASGSILGSASLTVLPPAAALVSIAITPTNPSILTGGTQQLTATGTYSDSSTQNLTNSVTWSSTNSAVATVSISGLVTGVATGSATIQASSGTVKSSTQVTVLATSNLAGWWTFLQGSGTAVPDSSGNGDTASLMNGVSWISGQNGYAISANGSNQYVQIPAVNFGSTQAVTWTAWVNRTYGSGSATLIENSTNFNSTATGFGFFPDDSADCGTAGPMMTGVRGDIGYTLNCYAQPSSGIWHHLAAIYDKSQTGTKAVSLYIDGLLQTPVRQLYTATNTNRFGGNPIYLFSRGGTGEFGAGAMNDLRLYSQALTAAQIQQIYQQGLGTLTSITVTPVNATVAAGYTQQYTAVGTYSSGATTNLTNSVTWSSTNPAAATINISGVATGIDRGSTTIQAVFGTVVGSTGLTVTAAPTLQSISVTPVSFSIATGAKQQLTATGTYSDGSTQNLTSSVMWSSTNSAVATVDVSGQVTGVSAGNANIQASSGRVNGSAQGTVLTASSLVGWWTFTQGSGTTAPDSSGNNNTATLMNGITWVQGQNGYAISANGSNQYIQIPAVNLASTKAITWTAWVNRTYGSGSATLIENSTNFNSTATGFGFFPDDGADCGTSGPMMTGVRGDVGYTLNCYAQPSSGVWHHLAVIYDKSQTGARVVSLYIDGVLQTPVRQLYTATNTNSFGSNPIYLFSRGGIGEFGAGEMNDLRLYNQALTNAQIQQIYQQGLGTLTSITVTPANQTLTWGNTQQYTATGTYNSGATADLTASATWSSTNTSVASITSSGLATTVAPGSTTIQAVSGTITGRTGLTVTGTVLQSILVAPANQAIAVGGTQQYTATGVYSNGARLDISSQVKWNSTNPSVATVSSTGLAIGVTKGTVTIQATLGVVTGSVQLTVTATGATLQSISVSPSTISILLTQLEQMTATGVYSDGSTQNLTSFATWTSSNPLVATIDSSGLVTGLASGTTTVEASFRSVAGRGSIVVQPAIGQYVQFDSGDGGATLAQTTYQGHAATTGNLMVAFAHWNNTSATATVQDQLGNTYTPIFQATCVGGTDCFQVWYAKNIKGGSPLGVTIHFSTRTTSLSVLDIIEYSGFDTTNPLDVMASATGSGTTQNSGNMPISTSAVETIVGLFGYQGYNNPYTAGPGFTFRNYDASTMWEDKQVSSIGIYNATATSAASGNWAAFAIGFRNLMPVPPGLILNPASVTAGSQSTGTVVLNAPAPAGGTIVNLSSGAPAAAQLPSTVTVPAGNTSASFPITTSAVTFTTAVSISATAGSPQSAILTVVPQTMAQVASDGFARADSATLGTNWTPLAGTSVNVPLQIVNGQIESSNSTSVGKEMYYGGLNWTPDQYSQVQILAATGGGNEGPAVRMSSNDTHYACLVFGIGSNTASVSIVLDYQSSYKTLASSTTATITAGDLIRCTAQGTTLTMTDVTSAATLLTATDATVPVGYPGVVDRAGGTAANYVMANWSGGASAQPLSATQFAGDNFNRGDVLDLGSSWVTGFGHGPIQIVNHQIEPYPAGGTQPSKQHFIAYGPFPNDQWSQLQVVYEDTVGDVAVELRASDTSDSMYVCDVNLTGAPGAAETRIVEVLNGAITPMIVDTQWSSIAAGDYIRGQVQGPLISLIDITTGSLLLTTYDASLSSGFPGISMQAVTGGPSDHVAANWTAGGFQ